MPPFFAAACELGLGFIPVVCEENFDFICQSSEIVSDAANFSHTDQSKYDSLSEDDVLQLLNMSSLTVKDFDSVLKLVY